MAPKRATRSTPGTENLTTTTVTNAQLQAMIDQGVTAALVARDANRNGDDSHTSGTGVRRNEHAARECTYPDFLKCKPLNFKMAPKQTTRSTPVTPTPNATTTATVTEVQLQALIDRGVADAMVEAEANRVRNGYDNNGSGPRSAQAVRECSYSEFLKCKHLDFKVTEGVIGLTRWFEKMESVFSISNCTTSCQVKFATCTLQGDALTWWNAHVKTTTPEAAHAMPWATLKKMMTDKYCPRGEIKKIEIEM
ncbi:hypothetical protein Tco_1101368 [Tanacetum coccineum]